MEGEVVMDDKSWQSVIAAAKDRQGLPPNIPFDVADPYIFHSITRPVTEEVVNALTLLDGCHEQAVKSLLV
jgi:hypothetical protein